MLTFGIRPFLLNRNLACNGRNRLPHYPNILICWPASHAAQGEPVRAIQQRVSQPQPRQLRRGEPGNGRFLADELLNGGGQVDHVYNKRSEGKYCDGRWNLAYLSP